MSLAKKILDNHHEVKLSDNVYMSKEDDFYRVHSGGFIVYKNELFDEAYDWALNLIPDRKTKKLVKESLNEKSKGITPIMKLNQQFIHNGVETDDINEYDDGFWVENDEGIRGYIEASGNGLFNINVQGMSGDVTIWHIKFKDVVELFMSLDQEWLIENDPEGDQY